MEKFHKIDSNYLEERKEFSKRLNVENLYDYIDHFGLYAGIHTLGQKMFVYEQIKKTVNIPGHIIEFGTWKGSNLLFLAKIMDLLSPHSLKEVIGFDNFSGLPEPSPTDGAYAKKMTGHYQGDYDRLLAAISLFGYDNYVKLVPGDAIKTIPDFEDKNPEVIVSFAYIDFDLYEPVRAALDFLDRTIAVGGVIVFDEAIDAKWPGETVAMKEFLNSTKHDFKMISNHLSRQPTVTLERIK